MSILDGWSHKWFGIWHEFGVAYRECPHIETFIFPEVTAHYDKMRLREYLTTAPIIASTSRASFPNPFTREKIAGSISFRTDGEWVWLDDLPDYIDRFDVAIPNAWMKKIQANGYIPPDIVSSDAMDKLEWPKT